MQKSIFDNLTSEIRLSQITVYLQQNGWTQKPFPRPEVLRFEGPLDDDGRPIGVMLPVSEDFSDYQQGLKSLCAG